MYKNGVTWIMQVPLELRGTENDGR